MAIPPALSCPPPPRRSVIPKVTDHVCEICHKVFKRSEHRQRHERAHRQEKPFGCRYCAKRFARKDLLIRHEKTIHADQWTDHKKKAPTSPSTAPLPSKDRARTGALQPNPHKKNDLVQNDLTNDAEKRHLTNSTVSSIDSEVSRLQDETSWTNKDFQMPEMGFCMPDMELGNGITHTDINYHDVHGEQPSQDMNERGELQQNNGYLDYSGDHNSDLSHFSMENENGHITDAYELLAGQENDFSSLDFFTSLDESIFAQISEPMLIPAASISPQSTGIVEIPSPANNEDFQLRRTSLSRNYELGPTSDQLEQSTEVPRVRAGRKSSRPQKMTIDDDIRDSLLRDLRETHGFTDEQLIDVPNARSLHIFLGRFFDCFQKHLPVFHLPTFDTANCQSPLILSMCAIGAIYHMNRKSASILRRLANQAITTAGSRKSAGNRKALPPTWDTQCKLLITFAATFGGSAEDVNEALAELGYFVRVYGLRRTQLSPTRDTRIMTWEEWIESETLKRLLLGMFIQSSLLTSSYDISPGFSVIRDLNFDMPAEDCLWEAPTREIWQENMEKRDTRNIYGISHILTHLMFGANFEMSRDMCSNISAFGATILMHAANIHLYYLAQCTHAFSGNVVEPCIDPTLRASRLTQVEVALTRCQSFLKLWQLANNDSPDGQDNSLIFNCQALLRLCYVRLFSGRGYFNRTVLLSEDEHSVDDAVYTYVKAPQTRNPFLTKSASQVLFCFTAPIRAGHLIVRKTAAFTWSIEHSIAAWDCALFLTKWIHTMEIQRDIPANIEEAAIMDALRELLDEVESTYDGSTSLAAEVTRTWTLFLDDVWVWEIASRMGSTLRKLADAYEEDWMLRRYPVQV